MAINYRLEVAAVYKSQSWAAKVKAMSDNQVYAIFCRLRGEGKIRI